MLLIFFFSGNYLVFAGIASNVVGAIRDVIYIKVNGNRNRFYCTIGLTMLMIMCVQFTYTNPASYLPIIGTLINTVALSFKNKRAACALTIFGQLFFISYYIILIPSSDLLTLINAFAAIMLFVSALLGLIFSFRNTKIQKI